MGSWNDLAVQDEVLRRQYQEVSTALRSSILMGFAPVLEVPFSHR
ncbi:MAG TPA: hypothetical protein VIC57_05760 [Candidatus Dormibacteraeota bacterium]|jgi:hypothetical protein